MDIAGLKLSIDSEDAKRAVADLDGLKRSASEVEKQTDKMGKSFSSMYSSMARMAAAAGAFFATSKITSYIVEVTRMAGAYEMAGIAMTQAGKNAGYSARSMAIFEEEVRKSGIAAIDARQTLTSLATANIDLAQATKLARAAQDLAVVGNINSSEAFQRLVYGIKSAQTEVLRTIGLNVNFEDSYKKAAEAIGKKVTQLTAEEKVQIRANAALEESIKYQGIYAESLKSAEKLLGSLKRHIDDYKVAFGQAFQPAFLAIVQKLTEFFKDLNNIVTDNGFQDAMRRIGAGVAEGFNHAVDALEGLIEIFSDLIKISNQFPEGLIPIILFGAAATISPTTAAIAAIVGFMASLLAMYKEVKEVQNEFQANQASETTKYENQKAEVEKLTASLKELNQNLKEPLEELNKLEAGASGVGPTMRSLTGPGWFQTWDAAISDAQNKVNGIKEAIRETEAAIYNLTGPLEAWQQNTDQLTKSIGYQTQTIKENEEEIKKKAKAISEVVIKIKEETQALSMSKQEQETYNALKKAGVEADSEAGRQIAELIKHKYHQIEVLDLEKRVREETTKAVEELSAERRAELDPINDLIIEMEQLSKQYPEQAEEIRKLINILEELKAKRKEGAGAKEMEKAHSTATKAMVEETDKMAKEMERIWDQMLRNIQDMNASTIRAMLDGNLDSWKDYGTKIVDMMKNVLAQIAAAFLQQRIILPIVAAIVPGGLGGLGGVASAATGGGGILGVGGSLFGGGGSLTSWASSLPGVSSLLGALSTPVLGAVGYGAITSAAGQAGLAGAMAAGAGETAALGTASIAGGGAAAAGTAAALANPITWGQLAGAGLIGALGYNYVGGALGLPTAGAYSMAGAGLGAAGGMLIGGPIGAVAGGLLGGLVTGSIFGGDDEKRYGQTVRLGGGDVLDYSAVSLKGEKGLSDSKMEAATSPVVNAYRLFASLIRDAGGTLADTLYDVRVQISDKAKVSLYSGDWTESIGSMSGGGKLASDSSKSLENIEWDQISIALFRDMLEQADLAGTKLQGIIDRIDFSSVETALADINLVLNFDEIIEGFKNFSQATVEMNALQAQAQQAAAAEVDGVIATIENFTAAAERLGLVTVDAETGLTNVEEAMRGYVDALMHGSAALDPWEAAIMQATTRLKEFERALIAVGYSADEAAEMVSKAISDFMAEFERSFHEWQMALMGFSEFDILLERLGWTVQEAASQLAWATTTTSEEFMELAKSLGMTSPELQQVFEVIKRGLDQATSAANSLASAASSAAGAASSANSAITSSSRFQGYGLSAPALDLQVPSSLPSIFGAWGGSSGGGAYGGLPAATEQLTDRFDILSRAVEDLDYMIQELTIGSMAPSQSYQAMQGRYTGLINSIRTADDPSQFTSELRTFLPEYMKFMSAYGINYQQLNSKVLGDLKALNIELQDERDSLQTIAGNTQQIAADMQYMAYGLQQVGGWGGCGERAWNNLGVMLGDGSAQVESGSGTMGLHGIFTDRITGAINNQSSLFSGFLDRVYSSGFVTQSGGFTPGAGGGVGGVSVFGGGSAIGGVGGATGLSGSMNDIWGSHAYNISSFVDNALAFDNGSTINTSTAIQTAAGSMPSAVIDPERYSSWGFPQFASGGSHLGGWRMVGERGPELEFTGPSRVASNNDSARMIAAAVREAIGAGGNGNISVIVKVGERELHDIVVQTIKTNPEAQRQIGRVAHGV